MKTSFPFETVWYGVDLGDLRPIDSTYGGEALDKLPPILPQYLDGKFSYLNNQVIQELENKTPGHVDIRFKSTDEKDYLTEDPKWKAKIQKIQASLPANITLPPGLVKFMSSAVAQELIPSCTACYFDLPDEAIPFNWMGEKGYIFHFYRDQQDCLFWYYYARENGESCILASPIPFDKDILSEGLTDEVVKAETFYTAHTFEEFIYRTWVENLLWFNLEDGEELDAEAKQLCDEYVDFYKRVGR